MGHETESKHESSEADSAGNDDRRLIALESGIGDMPFGREEMLSQGDAVRKRKACDLFKQAYEAQMSGELDEAAQLYSESIQVYPTAEAHTFLGWTFSFMGRTDDAIEECHRAIEVDPDFGNPYNDIGAYLIEKGDLVSAGPWLERAMQAPRYQSYYYPHFNLGRVYEQRGRLFEALKEYKTAIELNPKYALAIRAFRSLQARLN